MDTRFKKAPLTDSEMDLTFSNSFRIQLRSRKWKMLLFFIPVFILFVTLVKYIDLASFIIEFLKVVALLALISAVQFLLSLIEIKLGFKKVGQVKVLAKVDFFFFKVIVLREFLPLILEPQNQKFGMLNKHDFITLEKTGLNRLITWRVN